uniref:Uncharacterized protein n=1 Tax=Meloidogyne enterolobii TaxID=390850 RepID=A0A6V7X354_MELEN|nr:unnamed protein product [Meloidogyne enterolobii]
MFINIFKIFFGFYYKLCFYNNLLKSFNHRTHNQIIIIIFCLHFTYTYPFIQLFKAKNSSLPFFQCKGKLHHSFSVASTSGPEYSQNINTSVIL